MGCRVGPRTKHFFNFVPCAQIILGPDTECTGVPQSLKIWVNSCTSARKSMTNPQILISPTAIHFFDHLFASFLAVLHFLSPKMTHFLDLSPLHIYMRSQKWSKKRDGRWTDGRRTDAHRIFEALLHKSPFGDYERGPL